MLSDDFSAVPQAGDHALGPSQVDAEDIQVIEHVAEIAQPLARRIIRRQQPSILVSRPESRAGAIEQFRHAQLRLASQRSATSQVKDHRRATHSTVEVTTPQLAMQHARSEVVIDERTKAVRQVLPALLQAAARTAPFR